MLGGVTLAAHRELVFAGGACGNLRRDDLLAIDDALAAALAALVLDDFPFASAAWAGGLRLHHAEHALARADDVARAVAVGARLGAAALLGARAVTVGAGDVLLDFEFLLRSGGDFLKGELHLHAQVAAAIDAFRLTAAASETASAKGAAEAVSAEDVAEHAEDVVHREASGAEAACAAHALHTVGPELVVARALLLVAQHAVCLGSLLELLLGGLVARVAVGVVLDGQRLVRLLYFVFRGVLVNAQHFVVITFCHRLFLVLFSLPRQPWRGVSPCR